MGPGLEWISGAPTGLLSLYTCSTNAASGMERLGFTSGGFKGGTDNNSDCAQPNERILAVSKAKAVGVGGGGV